MSSTADTDHARTPTAIAVGLVPVIFALAAFPFRGFVWQAAALLLVLSFGWGLAYHRMRVRDHWPVMVLVQYVTVALAFWGIAAWTGDDGLGGASLGWVGGLWWGAWCMALWMLPVAVLRTALRAGGRTAR